MARQKKKGNPLLQEDSAFKSTNSYQGTLGIANSSKTFSFKLTLEFEQELLRLAKEGEIDSVSGFVRELVSEALLARNPSLNAH